jgi:hypothetical protein
MRRLLAILALLVATSATAHAQSIRLDEPIPAISVEPSISNILELYNREYTCLIFAHSESGPCVDAMREFNAVAKQIDLACAIVIITGEDSANSKDIIQRLDIEDYILAFDVDNHTLNAFGIQYVPFAVVYRSKNSRIEWFGPMHHVDDYMLEKIRKQ